MSITKLYLLNVPLENDYVNTLYFGSKTDQQSYFLNRKVKEYDNFSYQRKDGTIRVPDHYDNLLNCNYVMYQNTLYTNKWFYAFITDLKYIDDGRTDITIETDVIQTWFFDYTVKQSFVEREHVKDDTIGIHTIPEGLDLGEYISLRHNKDDKLKEGHKFVIASTVAVDGYGEDYSGGQTISIVGGMYGGIYTGTRYYTYEADASVNKSPLTNVLQTITNQDGIEAVLCVFMAPEFLLEDTTNGHIGLSASHKYYDHSESKPFDTYGLNGYQPKNKKLFTYPYTYLYVDNGNGANAIYHYEYFKNNSMKFHVEGVLTPGCSIRMVPLDYKGSSYADREGLNLGKLPICSWSSDLYTNWLTQNGVNVATSIINAGASMVGGAVMGSLSGGPFGTVAGGIAGGLSGATQIANSLNEVRKAEMIPPQTSGNINCGDVVTSANNNTFHYYHMSIKKEYAEIIDKYFDMFGYKVNIVKVPNRNHRKNYWYTKTINANITGAIPNGDMNKIKACYNNGITFWKNPVNIKDYSVSNEII